MTDLDKAATGLAATPAQAAALTAAVAPLTLAVALKAEALAVRAACAAVAALPIASQEQVDALGAGIKDIKARLKFLEASRKARTAGPLAEVESIRSEYREPEEAYGALEIATKARMLRYNQETRAAAEKAQQAALASQQAAHAAAHAGDMPAAAALQQASFQAISAAPEVAKARGIGSRFEWRARVVDVEKVPRAYMVVNEGAILAAVRANLPKAEAGMKPTEPAAASWAANGVEVYMYEIIVAR